MRRVNPATEEALPDYPDHTPYEIDQRLRAAGDAFTAWRNVSLGERSERMNRAGAAGRRAALS